LRATISRHAHVNEDRAAQALARAFPGCNFSHPWNSQRKETNMLRTLSRSGLLMLAAFCLALPLGSSRAAAQTSGKIATANVMKIFNEIQETKDLNAKMQNEVKNVDAQNTEKKQKLRDLQAARDALKPDSSNYEQKNQEWTQAIIEYQTWFQIQQVNLARTQKLQTISLFNKIQAAVNEVATQKGVDIVIAEQRPDLPMENFEQLKVEDVRNWINSRNVLFMNPSIDLSSDVIANLDQKYKSGK
jgi:Skp family chaperone for outer membrane proteins